MEKILAGGYLALVGSIWGASLLIAAGCNVTASYTVEYGMLLSNIIDMKLVFPLIFCTIITGVGVAMMLFGCFKKGK